MTPLIKNIIMYGGLAAVLVFGYIFFTGGKEEDLLSSEGAVAGENSLDPNSAVSSEFLSILLNIKGLKLDDGIFSDPVFSSLIDSSIVLVPDGNEGRPNPFAPLGFDFVNVNPAPADTGFSTGTN